MVVGGRGIGVKVVKRGGLVVGITGVVNAVELVDEVAALFEVYRFGGDDVVAGGVVRDEDEAHAGRVGWRAAVEV